MRLTSLLAIATAMSMAAAPAFATQNPAAKLSLTGAGAGSGTREDPPSGGQVKHGPSVALLAGVAVAAVVIGAVAMSHSDNKAASP